MLVHDLIPVSSRTKTPQGFLLVDAAISRTGLHDYRASQVGIADRDPNDVVKVYRPPEEVFADAAMQSFGRLPITNDHPGGDGQVTLDNINSLSVGTSDPEVVRDGDLMRGTLLITGKAAISDVESGKTQLSGGYHADFEIGAGTTPSGEAFDAIQRNIRGNHIAIVRSGRGGARVAIADKGDNPVKLTIDGKEFEVDQAVADAYAKAQGDTEAALKLVSDAEEESEKEKKAKAKKDAELEEKNKRENPDLKKDLAETHAKLDAALERIPTADQLDARADERAAVLDTARRLVTDIDTAGKSNETVRREVVEKLFPSVAKDVSDDYIRARYDGAAEGGGEADRFAQRTFSGPPVNDDNVSAGKKARADYVTDMENAHKPKVEATA